MPVGLLQASLTTRIRMQPDQKDKFAAWQSKFHAAIASCVGFISLEIVSPGEESEWRLIQRFDSEGALKAWKESDARRQLFIDLEPLMIKDNHKAILEELSVSQEGGVTEVFVTRVSGEELDAYHEWIGKIHQAEAKFPGFQRVLVQSPREEKNGPWITLLQFDTTENLDRWLQSDERRQILEEARTMVQSLESHRVTSPFAGWFANLSVPPPVWKQTMIILLVLYPIVMLEIKFLNPFTVPLDLSLATFIGNAISVSLVSWPMMPLAIYCLKWWLTPFDPLSIKATVIGTLVMIGLYLIEILIFWHF